MRPPWITSVLTPALAALLFVEYPFYTHALVAPATRTFSYSSKTLPPPNFLSSTSSPSRFHSQSNAARKQGGISLPLVRTASGGPVAGEKRSAGIYTGEVIGLGDFQDVTYNVLIQVGQDMLPLVLDTGSADLWVLSSDLSSPNLTDTNGIPLYSPKSFVAAPHAINTTILYGDSTTGTRAAGPVGQDGDGVGLAMSIRNSSTQSQPGLVRSQYLVSVPLDATNTSVRQTGSAGILGCSFPLTSMVWNQLLADEYPSSSSQNGTQRRDISPSTPLHEPDNLAAIHYFPNLSFSHHLPPPKAPEAPAENTNFAMSRIGEMPDPELPTVSTLLQTFLPNGPLFPSLLSQLGLPPMFAVSLQRDTIDVEPSGSGVLTLGAMPDGLGIEHQGGGNPTADAEAMLWVPVRGYTVEDGGLGAPQDSPGEVYPITWEIFIDDVYFDGRLLPRSNLSAAGIALSALVDTGSSYIRGPSDVISLIHSQISPSFTRNASTAMPIYPCTHPPTLSFSIGGRLFPVDPRDFGSQAFEGDTSSCQPTLAATDPPHGGGDGFLYSWNLGQPFLKGVLAAFYYGNLTYPSHDPPRIGFLSRVPSDAGARLQAAVTHANTSLGGTLPGTLPSAVVFGAATLNGRINPVTSERAPLGTLVPALPAASPGGHSGNVGGTKQGGPAGAGGDQGGTSSAGTDRARPELSAFMFPWVVGVIVWLWMGAAEW